jgi:hypothetical protein
MSNFKVDPQLPPTVTARKRGGSAQALGLTGNRTEGLYSIYDNISEAPDAANVPDGTIVFIRNGGALDALFADGGSYKSRA